MFGEFHSPVALAEMEVFHKYGIPFMACDVWSDQITAKGYPEVFRNAPAVSLIDVTIGQWIAAAGFKNVAIIAEKDDVGLAARTLVQQELTKAGIKFTAVDADPNLTDFTAQILRFKSETPPYDFFFSIYAEAGAYPMIRQSHDLGFAPTPNCGIYNSGGEAVDPTFWQNVGDAGKYLVTENVGLPKAAWNDKTKAFVAKYRQALQRRSVRRGDGKLRRRLAAVRCDQARRRHRPEGDHPRAGDHQLCRRRAASTASPPARNRPGTITSSSTRR